MSQKIIVGVMFLCVLGGCLIWTAPLLSAIEENNDTASLKEAFDALTEERTKEAITVLSRLKEHTPEETAARLFGAFSMNSWEEVIQLYDKLPEPYHSLEGYRGMVILSHVYLNRIPQAEELLNRLLQDKEETKGLDLPDYFRSFKEKKLDKWNRYYVAALFYKIVKKDFVKALEFLHRIKDPSVDVQLEIADIYVGQKKYVEAEQLLLPLLRRPRAFEEAKQVKLKALPQLANISWQLGDAIAAVRYFGEYFALYPEEISWRLTYAKVLMEIRRFDLASRQFELYSSRALLRPASQVDYIDALIRSGNLEKGNEVTNAWVSLAEIPLLDQLRLARLLLIAQNDQLVQKILRRATDRSKRTLEENQALISLYMDLANFEEAASLIALLKRSLEETVSGLLLLADFYSRIADPRTGYTYALQARQLDPSDVRVSKVLESYDITPAAVARNAKTLQEMLQEDSGNVNLNLQYVKNLIVLGIESYSSGQVKELKASPDLQKAQISLENLLRKNEDIPELHFLIGKIAYLFDDNEKALVAFQKAIQLCASYTEVYQYIGLLQQERQHLDDAMTALKTAVKYEPYNAKAWLQLGNLFVAVDLLSDAVQAFEQARKYAPYSIEPLVDLAEIHLRQDHVLQAVDLLNIALDLDPKDVSAVKLMLKALHHKGYERAVKDPEELKKQRLLYFDKLEAIDPKAAETLRQQFSLTK